MLIAPLVFFSLLGGLLHISGTSKLKELGSVTISYYLITTFIAIIIGLTAVYTFQPWQGSELSLSQGRSFADSGFEFIAPKQLLQQEDGSIIKVISKLFDTALVNPFNALADTNLLGIVFNALLMGLAFVIVLPKNSFIKESVDQINLMLYKVLSWVIYLLPVGIFAIVFDFKLKFSGDVFAQLLNFSLVVLAATAFHGLVVLPLIAKFYTGISPIKLFKKIAKPLIVALSSSSSSVTLPVSIQTVEEEFGVEKSVSGFVFPLGATMNMDGTALFEGIAAIFLAHLYGVDVSSSSMFAIFVMAMVSSIGAPGMSSGSMSGMQMVLIAAGIPLEAIGLLLVIERPLDTFRTAVNVEGDIVGALVVQHYINKKSS